MAKARTPSTEDLDDDAVQLARVDVASFIEYVLRDERTGAPIRLAPMHEEWLRRVDENSRWVLTAFIESGKSNIISIGYVLWTLYKNPMARIALVSSGAKQSTKLLASVSKYIRSSRELHRVAPDLRPSEIPSDPWNVTAITVRRPHIAKDPSVVQVSVGAQHLGARWDLVVADDVVTGENSRTPGERQRIIEWLDGAIFNRVVEGGKAVFLGMCWHPEDAAHVLTERGWPADVYGVLDRDNQPRWPERWSAQRIREHRANTSRLAAARELDCIARSDEASRFDVAHLEAALMRGAGRPLLGHVYFGNPDDGMRVVAGVDLAVGQGKQHDHTAISVVVVHGRSEHRELVALEVGRWDAPEIIRRILAVNQRFAPRVINVEAVGAQKYILDLSRSLGGADVPVRPVFTTKGAGSLPFAVDMLAVELARQLWTFRGLGTPEVDALVREMLSYSPSGHCGDRLASLTFAMKAAEATGVRVGWMPSLNLLRR